ncbi:MAG TPA: ComF family protein [Acetobacteraceae bacterium]|nr:ComF family protein [Acetobacteraceae bacterium]
MLDTLQTLGLGWLDVSLPPQCACCDARVLRQGQLCANCFGRTNYISVPCCVRCGVPFPARDLAGPDSLCRSCDDNPPRFKCARAALRYDTHARRLILPFKHGDRTELAATLAEQMARAGSDLLRRADLLIPVPLHRRRLFRRKYNQAALLTLALGRLSGVPALPDVLLRLRRTPSLDDRSAAERAMLVSGVFAVRKSRLRQVGNRHMLLIDDVMTSGATASACADVLLKAGAKAVDVLVAARVPDPRMV